MADPVQCRWCDEVFFDDFGALSLTAHVWRAHPKEAGEVLLRKSAQKTDIDPQ